MVVGILKRKGFQILDKDFIKRIHTRDDDNCLMYCLANMADECTFHTCSKKQIMELILLYCHSYRDRTLAELVDKSIYSKVLTSLLVEMHKTGILSDSYRRSLLVQLEARKLPKHADELRRLLKSALN